MRSSFCAIFFLAILSATARAEPPAPSENPYEPPSHSFRPESGTRSYVKDLEHRYKRAVNLAELSFVPEVFATVLSGGAAGLSSDPLYFLFIVWPLLSVPPIAASAYFRTLAERAKEELYVIEGPFAEEGVAEEVDRLKHGPMGNASRSLCARVALAVVAPSTQLMLYRNLQLGAVVAVPVITWSKGTLIDREGIRREFDLIVKNGKAVLGRLGL